MICTVSQAITPERHSALPQVTLKIGSEGRTTACASVQLDKLLGSKSSWYVRSTVCVGNWCYRGVYLLLVRGRERTRMRMREDSLVIE